MRHVRPIAVALSLLAAAVVLPAAADQPAASAAAPAVDRHDASAVAAAYMAAIKTGDVDAALALTHKEGSAQLGVRNMVTSMSRELAGGWVTLLAQFGLLPVKMPSETQVAAPEADGDTLKVKVDQTVTFHHTLVLVKEEDGSYSVDLLASLRASAPGGNSMLARQLDQMGRMPESRVAAQGEYSNPWPCRQKCTELVQALLAYAEEHDNRLPHEATWADELLPYLEGDKPFVCPDHADEQFSYAFNAAHSEAEVPTDWNQRQALVLVACTGANMPNPVFKMEELKALAPRHGKLNVACAADSNGLVMPAGMTPADLEQAEEHDRACQDRLRRLAQAALKYAEDHGGLLPSADAWTDQLQPYLAGVLQGPAGELLLVCPDAAGGPCTYAINREVAGKPLRELVNRRKIVLFVETAPGPANQSVAADFHGPARHRSRWQAEGPLYAHLAYANGNVGTDYGAVAAAETVVVDEPVPAAPAQQ